MMMNMAPAAARALGAAPPRVLSNHGVLSSPNATAGTVRFTRRTGGNRTVLSVTPRSGRRDEWDTDSGGGRLVDEDMATLRRRIREARAASDPEEEEGGIDGDGLPVYWTELERRRHGSFVVGVREAVGLLQAFLMSTRPGLGAGVVALALLSVPASVLLVSAQLTQAVDSISSALLSGR